MPGGHAGFGCDMVDDQGGRGNLLPSFVVVLTLEHSLDQTRHDHWPARE
jgi:hypothetical protein